MGIVWRDGFSASLQIALVVDGARYRIAKLSPTYLILADLAAIPAGATAKVIVTVDGRSTDEDVVLVDGARPDRQEPVTLRRFGEVPF